MANPYRGGDSTRVASGEPRTVSRPSPAQRGAASARPKDGRPTGPTGQPNYPIGFPPTGGTAGSIGDQIANSNRPPVAPGGGMMGGGNGGAPPTVINTPPPGSGFGPGGPANVSQGGPGGMLADPIIEDTLGKKNNLRGGK